MITVYSKPSCVQCVATYKSLERAGKEFTIINVEENPDAYQRVLNSGVKSLPMVEADSQVWHGFRPDLISKLK